MTQTQALVVAGHGSQRHAGAAAPIHEHADRIRGAERFDEVRTAFWREEPTLRDVATTVATDVAYVVPVLTSEGYFAEEVFPRELGVYPSEATAQSDGPEIRYADPVGTHPAMTDVVTDRVEATRDGPAGDIGVVVVGHGTERNARSGRSTRQHADRLRDRGRYAEVVVGFLDESPSVEEAMADVSATEVVVVPLFVADGYHTTRDVPAAIGHPGMGESAVLDGRLVHYTAAVGTEPRLADVIVQRAVEAGADPDAGRSSPQLDDAATAFLRRIDRHDGTVTWGELAVDGEDGTYDLRHRVDADARSESLERVSGPAALRQRVRHDDAGGYRPLSGAQTLPTGWVVSGLDERELIRSIRAVYPGSIPHWYWDRRGALPVTHLRETLDRQIGVYADLAELDAPALATMTEAVCGNCVRHRRWGIDGESPSLPTSDEGDTAIPCREVCPFFLAAAHGVLEPDGDSAAEPESSVPAGASEDPANRYRVEFAAAHEPPQQDGSVAGPTRGRQ